MRARHILEHSGEAALKLIAVGGVAIIALLTLLAQGMQKGLEPNEAQRSGSVQGQSRFDSARAFRDLGKILALGPRPSGSESHTRMREYIKRELSIAGLAVREHSFTANTPLGPVPMVNLVATVSGSVDGVIVITNHYDTKFFREFTFVGANDGGSTAAWMIELGRALGPQRQGRSIWLCWLDGEEAFVEWSATDGLYGSRSFVSELVRDKQIAKIKAVINVDMIGDCYLGIFGDPGAPSWLSNAIWAKAQVLGYGKHFLTVPLEIEDDHVPFRRAGLPALELIDFRYGGSVADHNRNWHTPQDTIDRVCPGSLQAVGDVIYHALPDIDAALNAGNARR
jgi:glutaminyl-peptide cyclotransferase